MKNEVRDRNLSGYFWIESAILEKHGKELGMCGLTVYAALACRADNKTNKTFISAGYIAKHTGMSERQAYREFEKMESLGLIQMEKRKGRTHVITLLLVEKNAKKVGKSKSAKNTNL